MKALHRLLPAALALGALVATAAPAEAIAGPTVVVQVPSAHLWVPGHWTIKLGRQVWVEGHFIAPEVRPTKRVYVPAHWEGHGRNRHHVPAHYR